MGNRGVCGYVEEVSGGVGVMVMVSFVVCKECDDMMCNL